jgi:hypothetical protein
MKRSRASGTSALHSNDRTGCLHTPFPLSGASSEADNLSTFPYSCFFRDGRLFFLFSTAFLFCFVFSIRVRANGSSIIRGGQGNGTGQRYRRLFRAVHGGALLLLLLLSTGTKAASPLSSNCLGKGWLWETHIRASHSLCVRLVLFLFLFSFFLFSSRRANNKSMVISLAELSLLCILVS